jgi:hypothetical protein
LNLGYVGRKSGEYGGCRSFKQHVCRGLGENEICLPPMMTPEYSEVVIYVLQYESLRSRVHVKVVSFPGGRGGNLQNCVAQRHSGRVL